MFYQLELLGWYYQNVCDFCVCAYEMMNGYQTWWVYVWVAVFVYVGTVRTSKKLFYRGNSQHNDNESTEKPGTSIESTK